MRLLLDTCTFVWLALQPDKLSPIAVKAINDASNDLVLSDVSLWEITLKNTAGKLPLPLPPPVWLPSRREFHGLQPVVIGEREILFTSTLDTFHTDPFDRLLVAQAIQHGLTLLSPDTPLSRLGAARIW